MSDKFKTEKRYLPACKEITLTNFTFYGEDLKSHIKEYNCNYDCCDGNDICEVKDKPIRIVLTYKLEREGDK